VPAGKGDVVVIVNAGRAFTVIERSFVAVPAVGVAESVTVTVKLDTPAVVGAPEITPVELSDNPAGSVPGGTDQVKGAVPPVATRVTGPYADPTVPADKGEAVVIVNTVGAFTVIDKAFVAVAAAASVTVTVKLDVAAVVGVPEITPAELSANPAGRVPAVTAHV
jgi:hypothetical protein